MLVNREDDRLQRIAADRVTIQDPRDKMEAIALSTGTVLFGQKELVEAAAARGVASRLHRSAPRQPPDASDS